MSRFIKTILMVMVPLAPFFALATKAESPLKLDAAIKMANGCLELARQENWQVAIAMVDDGGNLKYFNRMDGASLLSAELSREKALTSAKIPLSTQKLGEMSEANPAIRHLPGIVTVLGGLPIILKERHVGGIGVSGASGEQDVACAEAALSAVSSASSD